MRTDTGTHTTQVHPAHSTVAFYAILHLVVGAGIFYLTREALPQIRADIKVLISLIAAILGAGFVRTWTSEKPEETFMAAILASLLGFLSYIALHLVLDAKDENAWGKMATYGLLSLLSGGLSIVAVCILLFGFHRRFRR